MSSKKFSHINDVSINPVYLSARSAIVKPEELVPVTFYSLKKWLPRLGTERWSLVQLLRGLCIDAPRRQNGTKRVVVSWRHLAECLQVHEETIASWLKHEVIPDDKPWRRIAPIDDYAEYLALFIPRLRYAYETKNGKTRRVGFMLEILMEDPIAPEDEIKLAQQMELLSMQQGELGLDLSQSDQNLNPSQSNLPQIYQYQFDPVNLPQPDLPEGRHSNQTRLTPNMVNPENSGSLPSVKQDNSISPHLIAINYPDLPPGKSEEISLNVNRVKLLIDQLKQLKHQKRNYQQILEPLIQHTENLLEDFHSTAMYFKVLRVIFPDYTDIYVSAVEQALVAYAQNPAVNRGAVFVKTLRQLADQTNLDLGFKKSSQAQKSFVSEGSAGVLNKNSDEKSDSVADDASRKLSETPQRTSYDAPSMSPQSAPLEEIIWSEVLNTLSGQMPKSTYHSVMQDTELLGIRDGVYIVQVHTPLAKQWLNNRLKDMVIQALADVMGISEALDIQFHLPTEYH